MRDRGRKIKNSNLTTHSSTYNNAQPDIAYKEYPLSSEREANNKKTHTHPHTHTPRNTHTRTQRHTHV